MLQATSLRALGVVEVSAKPGVILSKSAAKQPIA